MRWPKYLTMLPYYLFMCLTLCMDRPSFILNLIMPFFFLVRIRFARRQETSACMNSTYCKIPDLRQYVGFKVPSRTYISPETVLIFSLNTFWRVTTCGHMWSSCGHYHKYDHKYMWSHLWPQTRFERFEKYKREKKSPQMIRDHLCRHKWFVAICCHTCGHHVVIWPQNVFILRLSVRSEEP